MIEGGGAHDGLSRVDFPLPLLSGGIGLLHWGFSLAKGGGNKQCFLSLAF